MKCTRQQYCKLLIIGKSQKYDYRDSTVMRCLHVCINLQFGEATIHWAHSLELTIGFECRVSLLRCLLLLLLLLTSLRTT